MQFCTCSFIAYIVSNFNNSDESQPLPVVHPLNELLDRFPWPDERLSRDEINAVVLGLALLDLVLSHELLDEPLRPALALVRQRCQFGVHVLEEGVNVGARVELLGGLYLEKNNMLSQRFPKTFTPFHLFYER